MLLLTIFIPLLSSIVAGLFGRLVGTQGAFKLTTACMGLNLVNIICILWNVTVYDLNYSITLGTWFSIGLLTVEWRFYIDALTSVMLVVVGSISFLVHLYSCSYMANDPHAPRFMSYLSMFTFFMILLITGDNFLILFLGWEGVGLCSYLLIGFWYTRVQANKSAIKAMIVNRISDFALIIGLACIYQVYLSFDFSIVFALTPIYANETILFFGREVHVISLISTLLFIGAMGKSAQIGLHTWLPSAMEGPTPVSALIHAATMVTAGVFLIIKCSPIFEFAPKVLVALTFIGAVTSCMAATIGLVQNDIKKVIAYSTCSQLGYMIFACGLSQYNLAFFHLVNHAFFKALLFLSAGAIIHSMLNEQDMRKYGSLLNLLPFTGMLLLIGSLALMGFPFLTGFYSKDLILEIAYTKYTVKGSFCYIIGLVTAFFTSFYSYRVYYMTFLARNNSYKRVVLGAHELTPSMAFVLIMLGLGSIYLGYIAKDLFVGLGTSYWNQSIFILPENNNQLDAEFIPLTVKLLPFFSSMLAILLGNLLFSLDTSMIHWPRLHSLLANHWYFDSIYNKFINSKLLQFCYNSTFKLLDRGFFEHIHPRFFILVVDKLATVVNKMQSGYAYRYGYFMVMSLFLTVLALDLFL